MLLMYFYCLHAFNSHQFENNLPDDLNFNESTVLMAGDSYIAASLDPSIVASSTNIAQTSEPYFFTYWKLQKVLSVNQGITKGVLGFSHHNISGINDHKLTEEFWKSTLFNRIYPIAEFDTLTDIPMDKLLFLKTYFTKTCLLPAPRQTPYRGGFSAVEHNNLSNYDFAIDLQYFHDGKNAGTSPTAIQFLRSIITLCEKKNIELILVTTPVHPEYFSRIPNNFKIAFEKLKAELVDEGITCLDYSQLSLTDDQFSDSNHVNGSGAREISTLVNQRIKQP